jgi:hypothetical protein
LRQRASLVRVKRVAQLHGTGCNYTDFIYWRYIIRVLKGINPFQTARQPPMAKTVIMSSIACLVSYTVTDCLQAYPVISQVSNSLDVEITCGSVMFVTDVQSKLALEIAGNFIPTSS